MKSLKMLLSVGTLAVCMSVSTVRLQAEPHWNTDVASAQQVAQRQQRLVLINFTGSDWCGWCVKLKREVFDQPEFDQYAKEQLVLVEADFPQTKAISAEQRRANEVLAKTYQVQGFPTLIVLGPNGQKVAQLGYQPGGAKPFVAELRKIAAKAGIQTESVGGVVSATDGQPSKLNNALFPWLSANARGSGSAGGKDRASDGSIGGGMFAAPGELRLKGLSGSGAGRLALINSETLAVGEEARISVGEKVIRVKCLEIKDRSVVVKVTGEEKTRELRLNQ